MISKNLISIIIPVKNAARFLNECLDSILSQKISKAHFQIILIDDNSSDTSKLIAQDYDDLHSNVMAIENKGQGIIEALKTGFEISQGEYISRMDADDVMPENKLQLLFDQLTFHNCDVVTGKVKYFRNDGVELGDGYKKYELWLNSLVVSDSYYQDIYKECTVASPNWMMRRNSFIDCGGFSGNYPEDYDLVFRWYSSNLNIQGIDTVTHLWRDHSDRASRNDPNYLNNRFLELKLSWFLKIDYKVDRELRILGAGKKGKQIANLLVSKSIPFTWYTNNPSKIGHNIYNQILRCDKEIISHSKAHQIIVAVAAPADKQDIQNVFNDAQIVQGIDYYLFS